MIHPEDPRPFGIVDLLRAKINSGAFPEGSKLPGETALAELLHTSRSIVRRAVVELGREGLVSAARGRGTFVRVRPERRAILIGTHKGHDGDSTGNGDNRNGGDGAHAWRGSRGGGSGNEDLLADGYDPMRRGWMPVSAWPGRMPGHEQEQEPAQGTWLGHAGVTVGRAAHSRDVRIVDRAPDAAETLGLTPKQPVVVREQRWRHQENGYVIALASVTPLRLVVSTGVGVSRAAAPDVPEPVVPLGLVVSTGVGVSRAAMPDVSGPDAPLGLVVSTGVSAPRTSTPDLSGPVAPDAAGFGDDGVSGSELGIAIYPELARRYGPVGFRTSVSSRMPTVRERVDLEAEVGVPLLIVTRVMLDPSGHPLEVTVLQAPADRFEIADMSHRPILSL